MTRAGLRPYMSIAWVLPLQLRQPKGGCHNLLAEYSLLINTINGGLGHIRRAG